MDLFIALFVFIGVPVIWVLIVLAAWRGKPASFSRERFGLSAASAGIGLIVLSVPFQKLREVDVRTPLYFAEVANFLLLMILFAVFGGCLFGVFAYKKGDSLIERFLRGRQAK